MTDPDGKGWVMNSPRQGGGSSKNYGEQSAGFVPVGLFIGQVSNESLILAQNQRWRRA